MIRSRSGLLFFIETSISPKFPGRVPRRWAERILESTPETASDSCREQSDALIEKQQQRRTFADRVGESRGDIPGTI